MKCFVELDKDYCDKNDCQYMDFEIGENIENEIKVEYSPQNIIFNGFSNKKTKTIQAGNILEKYIDKKKLIFFLKNNKIQKEIEEEIKFDLSFTIQNESDKFEAV